MEIEKKFECNICNKKYASRSSLSNHIRYIHGIRKQNLPKQHLCKHCKKEFSFQQSKWKHEQSCCKYIDENNANHISIIEPVQQELNEIKQECERQKQESERQRQLILDLQNQLIKSKRMDSKSFKALNKILMERSYKSSNNTVNQTVNHTVNNTINNTANNTFQIFSLGNEDITNVLTAKQKKQIINSRLGSLEKIVEITQCGDLDQFKNAMITNLNNNYAYQYDDKKGYFITVTKNELLEHLVAHRMTDIEAIYDELKVGNKVDTKTKQLIQEFIEKMGDEDVPFFNNETRYDNFKSYKIDVIKFMLYNNQDKITRDLFNSLTEKSENILVTPQDPDAVKMDMNIATEASSMDTTPVPNA